jgi:hypothetical protein
LNDINIMQNLYVTYTLFILTVAVCSEISLLSCEIHPYSYQPLSLISMRMPTTVHYVTPSAADTFKSNMTPSLKRHIYIVAKSR